MLIRQKDLRKNSKMCNWSLRDWQIIFKLSKIRLHRWQYDTVSIEVKPKAKKKNTEISKIWRSFRLDKKSSQYFAEVLE